MHKATLNQDKTKSFIGIVLFIICGSIIIWWVAQSTDAKMRYELLNQARTAAYAISVEDLISLTASERDIGTLPYERIKAQLASMRKAGPKTKFLYLMGKSSNGKIYFYADSLPQESEAYAFPGLIYDEVPDSYLRVFNSRREEV